jgi:hypothetical protein
MNLYSRQLFKKDGKKYGYGGFQKTAEGTP